MNFEWGRSGFCNCSGSCVGGTIILTRRMRATAPARDHRGREVDTEKSVP